jgi:hypothetical protein
MKISYNISFLSNYFFHDKIINVALLMLTNNGLGSHVHLLLPARNCAINLII